MTIRKRFEIAVENYYDCLYSTHSHEEANAWADDADFYKSICLQCGYTVTSLNRIVDRMRTKSL